MITLLYAAVLGILVVVLSLRIVLLRRAHQVGVGTGNQRDLERAIRVHGNLIEYAPLALILLLLLEMQGAAGWQLHALGATLVLARLLHAFGLSRSAGVSLGRLTGTVGTYLVILLAAGAGLWKFFAATAPY